MALFNCLRLAETRCHDDRSQTHDDHQTHFRRNRLWLAGGGVAAVAALIAGFWLVDSGQGNAVARPEKVTGDTDGAFRPSDTQWASLRLAAVRQVAFRDERATDGKIAINEDTTTPVFSPYSGRVSKLIARPGDHVERGAPLFAIEASEFVQGQNDLVTAVAGVDKAKSRLQLAPAGREAAEANCWRSRAARSRTSSRRSPTW